MVYELRGIASIPLEEIPPAKKGICTSRSFGKLITEKEEIKEAVANFASKVGFKLRKQNSCTGVIQVFLQTNQFRTQDLQFHRQITRQIPAATSCTSQLVTLAVEAIDMLYKPGFNYHKCGIIALDIVPKEQVQGSLWNGKSNQSTGKIMNAMDSVNKYLGEDMVKICRQGYSKKWKLRSEHMSKCYTTRLEDIVRIRG